MKSYFDLLDFTKIRLEERMKSGGRSGRNGKRSNCNCGHMHTDGSGD